MEQLLDEERFGELCDVLATGPDGRAELASYVELFLDNTGAAVHRLRPTLASGDVATLRTLVHQVKGTTATLGATRVARRCAEVEEALGGDGTGESLTRLSAPLSSLFDDYLATAAALRLRLEALQITEAVIQPEK